MFIPIVCSLIFYVVVAQKYKYYLITIFQQRNNYSVYFTFCDQSFEINSQTHLSTSLVARLIQIHSN